MATIKIVAISDTHCKLHQVRVPNGHILVHCGDLTFRGAVDEIVPELDTMAKLPHKIKILIPGNHDGLAEHNPALFKQLCQERNITFLNHEPLTVLGIKFFGSGYSPEFCNWYLGYGRGGPAIRLWDQIPEDTEILLTHGPAMGILDGVKRYHVSVGICETEHVGCYDLMQRIKQLPNLRYHISGHIHNAHGTEKHGKVTFINASNLNDSYQYAYPATVFGFTKKRK